MFNWFRSLNPSEARAFYACFGGWAVDALDTQIFSFLIPVLIATWHMSQGEAGLLGTAALISSAIGGWGAGMLCDRLGRVFIMKLAVAWFVFFTILCGFANSYEQLFVARVLSGIGFGGEWAAGAVLIGETIRPEFRGKAVGTVQSAYSVGYAVAAVMSAVLFSNLPDHLAWRSMFWLGVVPALFVFLLLRNVKDSEVYLSARRQRAAKGTAHVNPLMIFHRSIVKTTIFTSILALGVQAGGFALTLWLPTFLKTVRGFTVAEVGYHMVSFTVGSFFGFLIGAYLSDALGRRLNFLLFAIGNGIMIPAFLYLPSGQAVLFLLDALLGFFCFGIYSALGPYFTELFPSAIRATGQGFSYNFGRGVGAFFPAVVGLLSSAGGLLSLRDALAIAGCGAYFFVLLAIAFLPETRGRDLSEIPDLAP
ncbi:MFS transporter [Solimonas marina]|uniref:MFS transporter n=1 Tax=Solimonas marina TaxID=2714601 RepID=A0A970B7W8_9GAMM|nr:MFS transporter [Solimonas marina]NKF24125.1 MFS transporter [Solimonas marina]